MSPLWQQTLLSFAAWLAYGWFAQAPTRKIAETLTRFSRSARMALGLLILFGSIVVLFGCLLWVDRQKGISPNGMTALGWVIITVAGILFVQAQMLAAMNMVRLLRDEQPNRP
jgi:hypothetical protein